jgi:hypothetical protein
MTPAVGNFLILDGIARVIEQVLPERNKVRFGNPPDTPAKPSRAGTCALSELVPLETPGGTVWYLPGRLEVRLRANPNTVVLEAAEHKING